MIGNNKLHLNQAEMNKAVEYYLNTEVLKKPCSVNTIDYMSTEHMFVITLMPPKEIVPEPIDVMNRATALEKK